MVDKCIHRGKHHKGEDGRSAEIESYIQKTFDWYMEVVDPRGGVFLDVGADYGYAMKIAEESGRFDDVMGIEPFPPSLNIATVPRILFTFYQSSFMNLKEPTHLFINHVFEHLESPLYDLKHFIKRNNVESILISTPHARCPDWDWVYGESHNWIFTPEWFQIVLTRNLSPDYMLVGQTMRNFRKDWVEIWNAYRRR